MAESANLTLRQIYPLCGIGQDASIRLCIDTSGCSVYMNIKLRDIPRILAPEVLDSRVSLIHHDRDANSLTLTIKMEGIENG